MKILFTFSIIVLFLAFSQTAISKNGFQNFIPYGKVNSCLNCHFSSNGGSRNAFGKAAQNSMSDDKIRWDKIFNLDSDGDGFTNGEELQDADGQWAIGQSDPGDPSLVTLPGDASSKPTKSSIENELANNNSTIYPVPTLGIVNLDFVSNYYETSKLELFNSNGNLVYTENIESIIGQNKWTLNLNNHSLNNGVYFLVLRNRYYNIRKRVIFAK